ncbi:MAG: DUF3089 domain-containing protein [Acidimicrobiales bacterium]|nr:DUF3089 domain-containing protein [Acidimicrobiales bacterium]
MTKRGPRRLLGTTIAFLLLATACSSDDTTSAEGGTTTTASSPATTTTAATTPATSAAPTTEAPATTTTEAVAELPPEYIDHESEIYGDETVWLCLPGGADDVCDRELDTTIVYADGSTELRLHEPATDPAIDCFYLYPTTSRDQTASSDLIPGEEGEIRTTLTQFARLTAACRTFAPVYRSRTLAALTGSVEDDPSTRTLAYDDSLDAFRYYVANLSEGRPFVLMGHSQGAGILARLIEEEIDDTPALRDRLVSAMLFGTSVAPDRYDNIVACQTVDETGCMVSYSSYRSTAGPFEGAFFGRADEAPAMCVNPVDPAGGAAFATPQLAPENAFADPAAGAAITTPFVSLPDFIEVECVDDGSYGFLELRIMGDPDDPRADDIVGDLTPEWGMHIVDMGVAMFDIVALVETQAAAFAG